MAQDLNVVNTQKKRLHIFIQKTEAEHSWQMGLSVYHSPWIPSLLAFRKKRTSFLLTLGCVILVVRSVNMPMVSKHSISCFKFAIQMNDSTVEVWSCNKNNKIFMCLKLTYALPVSLMTGKP